MLDFQWRDIPGFPGYQASNFGQIKSVRRTIVRTNNSDRVVPERILRPGPMRSGHLTVALGRGNSQLVHRLVMLAFCGPAPEKHEVLHLDHNPKNNRLCNLKYGTRSENLRMDYNDLRRSQAVQIRAIEPTGEVRTFKTLTDAAKFYGVQQPTASTALKHGWRLRKSKVLLTRRIQE